MANDQKQTFRERLAKAVAEGEAGRRDLIVHMSRMSLEHITSMPAHMLAMLGPEGLAAVAGKRSDMSGLSPKVGLSQAKEASSSAPMTSRHPLTRTGIVVAVVLTIGSVGDTMLPALRTGLDSGVRSVSTSTWEACPRLDRHVDGCLYTSGRDGLTLEKAAGLLSIPTAQLLAVNTHLTSVPTTPLTAGSVLVVWRNKLELKGSSR
ncbi:hypothetical protein [Azorhizobium caulinodans]|uniref:hypothetical protein n=1 Tax=Azorhizobium caulinodans TaxID=7 RepID=UPI002FBE461D